MSSLRSNRWKAALAGVVVLGALAWAALFFLIFSPGDDQPDRQQQAREAASALMKLPDDPEASVAKVSRDQMDRPATDAVPSGTKLEPDATSWAPDGFGGGTMEFVARYPDGSKYTGIAVMELESDGWKVIGTIAVS